MPVLKVASQPAPHQALDWAGMATPALKRTAISCAPGPVLRAFVASASGVSSDTDRTDAIPGVEYVGKPFAIELIKSFSLHGRRSPRQPATGIGFWAARLIEDPAEQPAADRQAFRWIGAQHARWLARADPDLGDLRATWVLPAIA